MGKKFVILPLQVVDIQEQLKTLISQIEVKWQTSTVLLKTFRKYPVECLRVAPFLACLFFSVSMTLSISGKRRLMLYADDSAILFSHKNWYLYLP